MIMEHADGVQLHQIWPNMAGEQRIRCINAIVQKIKEIANMEFPAYGSLYYATAGLSSASKVPLNQDFCIGPHCGAMYWNCNPAEPKYYQNTNPNQGPCKCVLFQRVSISDEPKGLTSSHTATV